MGREQWPDSAVCLMWNKLPSAPCDATSTHGGEVAVLPSPVCVRASGQALTVRLMSSLLQNSPLTSCLSCRSVIVPFDTSDWKHFYFPSFPQDFFFPFIFSFFLSCCVIKLSSLVCLAGSVTTEEEHHRVPGRDEYPDPGCSGADRRLSARCRGRARQLEEPRCQPLQRLLQLQRRRRLLWQGNADRAEAITWNRRSHCCCMQSAALSLRCKAEAARL